MPSGVLKQWIPAGIELALETFPDVVFCAGKQGHSLRWSGAEHRFVANVVVAGADDNEVLTGLGDVWIGQGRIVGCLAEGSWQQRDFHELTTRDCAAFQLEAEAIESLAIVGLEKRGKFRGTALVIEIVGGVRTVLNELVVVGNSQVWDATIDKKLGDELLVSLFGHPARGWADSQIFGAKALEAHW